MAKHGPEFYDDDKVFETYIGRRNGRQDSPNDIIEQPIITSSDAAWKTRGPRQHWIVDNYFDSGPRQTLWMNGEVIKYHRTIEEYFLALQKAGFTIKSLRESRPKREYFTDDAQYQRRMRIPLMLFFETGKA